MRRAIRTKPADRIEFWFSILSLVILSAALYPVYDLTGLRSSDYTAVNPLRLALSVVCYGVAAALALYRWKTTRTILVNNPVIVLLFLLPLISVAWSVDPSTTLRRGAAHFLTGMLCVYLAGRMDPEEFLRRLVLALFIGGVFSFLYVGLVPANGIHHNADLAGSWAGAYGHKNELGRISAVAIIAAAFMTTRSRGEKAFRYLVIGMFFVLLAMSQSKTNWITMVAMLAFIPMIKLLGWRALPRALRVLIVLSLAGATALVAMIGVDDLLAAFGRGTDFSGRATLWNGVTQVIAVKYPYFGAGYGAFFTPKGAIADLEPYLVYWGGVPNHAHNGVLNTRADMGWPGLIALGLFVFVTGKRLIARILTEGDRAIWLGFGALYFLFLVNNFTESVAFKHSDIAWALVLVVSIYARDPLKAAALSAAAKARNFTRLHPSLYSR